MPITEFIPTNQLRDRLGNYPHPVDKLIDLKDGKKAVSYTGCVLETYERNFARVSEFHAVVFDKQTGICKSICYRITSTVSTGGAVVDASEDIKVLAREWLLWWHERYLSYSSEITARKVIAGRCVRFVKGYRPRSEDRIPVEAGQLAYIETLSPDKFTRSETFNALVVFTNGPLMGLKSYHKLDKLEVFAPEVYERDPAEIEKTARTHAASENWRIPFTSLAIEEK